MSFSNQTHDLWLHFTREIFAALWPREELNLELRGEDTTYLRLNNSKIRQNTQVEQRRCKMTFHHNGHSLAAAFDLSGSKPENLKTAKSILAELRQMTQNLPQRMIPPAPMSHGGQSLQMNEARPLASNEFLQDLKLMASGMDLVGLLASGQMVRASANHLGQNHWLSNRSFFFDYSIYTESLSGESKAIKDCYADTEWSHEKFLNQISENKKQLSLFRRNTLRLDPKGYRVYLAPAATAELVRMFTWASVNWNPLSLTAYKKGTSAFTDFIDGKKHLSSQFSLIENFELGLSPRFNSLGELAPSRLTLIENGRFKNLLISTPASIEHQLPTNCADLTGWFPEGARSLELASGSLPEKKALAELGTGVFISNLHYCNWSDLKSARLTGMTRYACFWVENGEIKAPIQDMRFDVSLYDIWGPCGLVALSQESKIDPLIDTYGERSMGGLKAPGMLVDGFNFVL